MDTKLEWYKIIASLIGGGAIGAIITAIVTSYRNRIQPIGKSLKIETVFAPRKPIKDHLTTITFSGKNETFHFDNLYLAQIVIQNEGNMDYTEFNFGLTLPNFGNAVNVKSNTQDRHHVVTFKQNIDFGTPSNIIDCTLKPFNRKDKYYISIYVTCSENKTLHNIDFSSEMPIRFKEIETFTGTTLELLVEVIGRSFLFPLRIK